MLALLEDGLASPLLAQIVEGIRPLGFLCSGEYLPPGSLAASLPLKSDRAPILKGSSSNHHFSRANMLNFWGGCAGGGFSTFFCNVQSWIVGDDDSN